MKTVKVQICVGTHCTMMGAMDIYEIVNNMNEEYQEQQIEVEMVKCFGDCKTNQAPVVMVDGRKIIS
ncbi:MAG TPA: (2Fe-2S) ferredoxin domain-containing protein, partial [Bacillota bacterium]|nr:(2Fe-2S) ferredoxin domain-containing protein [Bacillota bacterium]